MNNKFLYKLKRYLTLDGYSVAPVHIQLLVLLAISFLIIGIFSVYYGSFADSYYAFMDPTSVPDGNILIVIVELLIGLIIASFVISILSSALENFIAEIKKGILPFKRADHLVFINQNNKIKYIFDELNIKYKDIDKIKEIVIILSSEESVELFLEDLEDYTNLSIFVKYGNLYDIETYRKFALDSCENITILLDEEYDDDFLCDNNSIKILSTLVQDKNIKLQNINLTIESYSTNYTNEIYGSIAKTYNLTKISFLNADELLGQLLTRSMIDVIYYKIYAEIFTFDGFELYIEDAKNHISKQTNFKELLLKSNDALLLGVIKNGDVCLNNLDLEVALNDKLIFIAEDETKIKLTSKYTSVNNNIQIAQPSEIVTRKICMIGDGLKVKNLFEFLDDNSQQNFKEYVFDSYDDYTSDQFITNLVDQNFDTIIINLEEELTLRYILMLVAKFGKENKFISKCISIITNPHSAKIINEITGSSNVILSQRLSAQFISQLCFDSQLINIINELTTSDGAEFNIIDTNDEKLNKYSKEQLKQYLINHNMTYIGTVNSNKNVEINSENIRESKKIIVLSEGVN